MVALILGTWLAYVAGVGRTFWKGLGQGVGHFLKAGWWRPWAKRPQTLQQAAATWIEQIRTSLAAGTLTFLPHMDDASKETPEIRAAYREMERDETVKAALWTKVLSVCSLALQVHPEDKDDPEARRQADFVAWAFRKVRGTHTRLVRDVLRPGLVDGWSLCHMKMDLQEGGKWDGKWFWSAWKSKDTNKVDLGLDNYRNVEVVRGSANDAGRYFDPQQFVRWSHLPSFENPYGTSDLRAAYRHFVAKDTVLKLWALHLDKYGSPFLKGTYPVGASDVREALEEALEKARANTWLTIPTGALVEAVEITSQGPSSYADAIDRYDRAIMMAIAFSYLQAMEGQTTGARAMGEVHQQTSELPQWFLSDEMGILFTAAAEWLVRMNFADPRPPQVTLEAVSQAELKERADVDKLLQDLGLKLSKREAYDVYGRAEPTDPEDELGGGQPPPGSPPPGGGTGGQGPAAEPFAEGEANAFRVNGHAPPLAEVIARVQRDREAAGHAFSTREAERLRRGSWVHCDSTAVDRVRWHPLSKKFQIVFATNRRKPYTYYDVPEESAREFAFAPSKGQWVNGPGQEFSVPRSFGDEGFSGVITDKRGRKRKYERGRQVPLHEGGGGGGEKPAQPEAKPVAPAAPASSAPQPAAPAVVPAPAANPDPAANRPSRPEERHLDAAGAPPKPASLPWQAPPPKRGKKGEGMRERPKGDESQTKIGDLGEALAGALGFRSILPSGQRAHRPGEVEEKGSTIDAEYDHSGRAYELKLCNDTATEYRLKAKSTEKEAKERYATQHGLAAHVLVGVREVEGGVIHFYAGKEPGLTGAEVSPEKFDYVGSVDLSGKVISTGGKQ